MPLLEDRPATNLMCAANRHNEHGRDRGASNEHQQENRQADPEYLPSRQRPCMNDSKDGSSLHQRAQSLHVNWTEADVTRLAREIYNQTVADVHLSLFGFWIREDEQHYEIAKQHIRELGLDQVRLH